MHIAQEEEARRNSIMSDMLFVSLSHTLSPYIFSLDDRCKHMTDKDRVLVKERLDPGARFVFLDLVYLCLVHIFSRWLCIIWHGVYID